MSTVAGHRLTGGKNVEAATKGTNHTQPGRLVLTMSYLRKVCSASNDRQVVSTLASPTGLPSW
jgi:hypothetical protein